MKKNILVVVGGDGTEHDISLISADYIESKIDTDQFNIHRVLIDKNGKWTAQGLPVNLNLNGKLDYGNESFKIDAAIPCIHGPPGESGEIQSLFKMADIPFLGCGPETSMICFNKLATKLFLESARIPTSPFINLPEENFEQSLSEFMTKHPEVYIKATNQGSSVGCYFSSNKEEALKLAKKAFQYSPYVIVEKSIKGRELEVAVFEYQNQWTFTRPGEIDCPNDFYTYEEKYAKDSKTKTLVEAPNLSDEQIAKIQSYAKSAQELIQIKDLARIDFFLADDGEILINEINTFPGHTPISMFPSMMENAGVLYSDYINYQLNKLCS